jgi:hypothetical protein
LFCGGTREDFQAGVLPDKSTPRKIAFNSLTRMRTSVLQQWLHFGGEYATTAAVGLLEKLHLQEVADLAYVTPISPTPTQVLILHTWHQSFLRALRVADQCVANGTSASEGWFARQGATL